MENVLLSPPPIAALKTETGAVLKVAPKSTVTMSSYAPKVRNFSGGDNKGEIAYDIWRYDVKIALKDPTYTKTQKDFAIRRSLSGSAARMIMYQGLDKPINDLLEILDSVYGSVDNKEQLLSEFYSACQKEDEDVTTWSNRLQDILGKGIEKGIIPYHEMNTMLHAMLWTGLRQELKDVSGHKYDSIQDFNHLRVALRQIEKAHQPKKNTKPNTSKAATTSPESKDVEELKGMVQQLTHQFTELRDQRQQEHAPYRGNGGYRGSGRGGRRGWNQTSGQNSNWQGQNNNWQNRGTHDPVQQDPQQQQQRNDYPIVCHRCGQEGHIKIGCRTRMDHSRNLNARKPVQRGRY